MNPISQTEKTTEKDIDIIQNAVITMTVLQQDEKLYANCNIHPIASQQYSFMPPLALALSMNGLYSRVMEDIPENVRNEYINEYKKHLEGIQKTSNKIKRPYTNENTPKLELMPTDTTTPETSGNGWEYPAPKLEIY